MGDLDRTVQFRAMRELTIEEEDELVKDLLTRAGTAAEIAKWYDLTKEELTTYVASHRERLEALREKAENPEAQPAESDATVTPEQLDQLWISNKFERLKRAQRAADILYADIETNKLQGAELSTSLREFRSYCMWVSNELGQLMHRGSGDAGSGDVLGLEFVGIDINSLK